MVDLLDHAVLIGGLDFWKYPKDKARPFIDEARLRDAIADRLKSLGLVDLSESEAFIAPPRGDDKEHSPHNGVQVMEFPSWFVCQSCRALNPASNLEGASGAWKHACKGRDTNSCVPVRFVATCKRGHLEEFPWRWFVHKEGMGTCSPTAELRLIESPSGDFSEIVIECECGVRRSLAEARHEHAMRPCRGERPWLGPEGNEEAGCSENHLELLVRTATSSYFAQTVSALSIPDPMRVLLDTLRNHDVWDAVEPATDSGGLAHARKMKKVGPLLAPFGDNEVLAGISIIKQGTTGPREALRTAEYRQLIAQPEDQPGELPGAGQDFFARRLPASEEPGVSGLGRIVLAKKLREVRAQVGFSRLASVSPNLQGEYDEESDRICRLGLNTDWLPASEIYGEGVLICLDEKAVLEWEHRQAVVDRTSALLEGFACESSGKGLEFPGARFYLLHSLAHLLISAISLDCGYAASAIRERIYCSRPNEQLPMAAILLHTGTPGAEGTLGGLVEQGRRVRHHLARAFDLGTLCSNDPVCAAHNPKGPSERYLEGAACHGCLYIAESACERWNRFLDRALVFPTIGKEPELAFFPVRP
jgi:hypothetical protein